MKFGKYFQKNINEKWSYFYVDYKKLKKEIKNEECNYEELLDKELIKINKFVTLIDEYDETNENIGNFLVLNYMALFKSIKKYDKKKNVKNVN